MTEDRQDAQRLRLAFLLAAAFAGLLWLIKLSELTFGLFQPGLVWFQGRKKLEEQGHVDALDLRLVPR